MVWAKWYGSGGVFYRTTFLERKRVANFERILIVDWEKGTIIGVGQDEKRKVLN